MVWKVRRVYDDDTGRIRLVKGTGEILEDCVSRHRQYIINKQVRYQSQDSRFFYTHHKHANVEEDRMFFIEIFTF
jgi:hypothetical protein